MSSSVADAAPERAPSGAPPAARALSRTLLSLVRREFWEHRALWVAPAVVAALSGRRSDLHVVVTGRNAKPAVIAAADLVTEMTLVKHHFTAGVKAQPGIEF